MISANILTEVCDTQEFQLEFSQIFLQIFKKIQSGACSPAKHGDAYFSAVYGFMKDPIATPGPYKHQEV